MLVKPVPTAADIKEVLAYVLNVAKVGKLTISPTEAQEIVKNLTVAEQLLNAIPGDAVLKTPAELEAIERLADAEAEASRAEAELEVNSE